MPTFAGREVMVRTNSAGAVHISTAGPTAEDLLDARQRVVALKGTCVPAP
ncbi:hypothetical protein BH20ACT1_BH20ACT1_00820 [soil metagenome]